MILSCSASFTNKEKQRDFCKLIKNLGGIPCEIKNEVVLLYEGNEEEIAQLARLFEQQNDHKIQISDKLF